MCSVKKGLEDESYEEEYNKRSVKEGIIREYSFQEMSDLKQKIAQYFQSKNIGAEQIVTTPSFFDQLRLDISTVAQQEHGVHVYKKTLSELYFFDTKPDIKALSPEEKEKKVFNKNSRIINGIIAGLEQYFERLQNKQKNKDYTSKLEDVKSLLDNGQYQDALLRIQRLQIDITDEGLLIKLTGFLAILYAETNEILKAGELFTQVLEYYVKKNDTEEIIKAKANLIDINCKLDQINVAEVYATEYLHYAKNTDKTMLPMAYIAMSRVNMYKCKHEETLALLDIAQGYAGAIEYKNERQGVKLLTHSYYYKCLCYYELGSANEAALFAKKAIDGFRELNNKQALADSLFRLCSLELSRGNFKNNEWVRYAEESRSIFIDTRYCKGIIDCNSLLARIAGKANSELALDVIQRDSEIISKIASTSDNLYYQYTVAVTHYQAKHFQKAEEILNQALTNSADMDIRERVKGYQLLAEICFIHKKNDIGFRWVNYAIQELTLKYENTESDTFRAETQLLIANLHLQINEPKSALTILEQLYTFYKKTSSIKKLANVLLQIAEIKETLNERYCHHWLELSELVKGTTLFFHNASAKLGYGKYLLRCGEYYEAKKYFDEAYYISARYGVLSTKTIGGFIESANQHIDLLSATKVDFNSIIYKLYAGFKKYPNSKHKILRYWYWLYNNLIIKYIHDLPGLKLGLIHDDLEKCELHSKYMQSYFDYFIFIPPNTVHDSDVEHFPHPFNELVPGEYLLAITPVEKEINTKLTFEEELIKTFNEAPGKGDWPRYSVFKTEIDGMDSLEVLGWKYSLAETVYDFFEQKSENEVMNGNRFILNGYGAIPKLSVRNDLPTFVRLGVIPIYFTSEVDYNGVSIIGDVEVTIPIQNNENTNSTLFKRHFYKLLTIENKENARYYLNEFKVNLEELYCESVPNISIQVLLIQFDYLSARKIHPCIILDRNSF